ncbi:MAG: Wzz/FepE/Etk N-terminal domain-containing protein [Treponema sp.]|nr:Wzz/FepE/Etk N-terminal domain-containing protein [Treponema sp.]
MSDETKKENDEISLIDLFAVLWHRKKMIIAITLSAMVGVLAFSVISLMLPPEISPLPDRYTPRALMLINDGASPGGGLASMLGDMGGLAALVGMGGMRAGTTYSDLAVFLLETNSLLDSVVDEFGLIERFDIDRSPRASSRDELRRLLRADFDNRNGVLTITFTDRDPEFAKNVVNFTVAYLENRFEELGLDRNRIEHDNLAINIANTFGEILRLEEDARNLQQSVAFAPLGGPIPAIAADLARITMELEAMREVYVQLRVQHEILRVTMASENPIFQILEMAEAPDRKSGPSRGLISIIVTFAAAFLSVFLAFALNAISNIRKDPEAMAKLRGVNV